VDFNFRAVRVGLDLETVHRFLSSIWLSIGALWIDGFSTFRVFFELLPSSIWDQTGKDELKCQVTPGLLSLIAVIRDQLRGLDDITTFECDNRSVLVFCVVVDTSAAVHGWWNRE